MTDIRERAQQIADEHNGDAYSVALAMLEGQDKIKAEAVREAASKYKIKVFDGPDIYSEGLIDYANKLESKND